MHEAAGRFLAQLANARDSREAINLLMKQAGSDTRWEEGESWDHFRERARPEVVKLREALGRRRP